MTKKIVAIGGGDNGRIRKDGTKAPYETRKIDEEIVKLTCKEKPNFLFLGHSQNEESKEETYFEVMKSIYGDIFGCNCKTIKRLDLKTNMTKVQELVEWADIIYEGGGDTKSMVELWKETGFDNILINAWNKGKVMCGVSAGANCWFKLCSSDSLKIQLKDETAPLIDVEGLNLVNAYFTPHCNIAEEHTNRLEHMKESLKGTDMIGIGISNCCAIEIIDNEYRLIIEDASNYGIDAYGIKTYWENENYIENYIDDSIKLKQLKDLLIKN